MVNVSLVQAILREQDDPGCSTTRQIRDLYNDRSGDDPITQHSDEDTEFQSVLLKALETFANANDEDEPISYTVKLKDSDESTTPTIKRRSIIKLPKETNDQSESDETSSDSEKPSTASSTSVTKPFSPLFLNNMKKFGVSSDWLAKRSNSLRHSAYSRSSVKSNASKLDAMIKSASAKPIRSNRKLSFVETTTTTPTKVEIDKENTDPSEETNEKKEELTKTTSPYDLSSEIDEDKDNDSSPTSKEFSLRIPRVNLSDEGTKRSSSLSSNDESKKEKPKIKKKRRSKKDANKKNPQKKEKDQKATADDTKKSSPEKAITDDETKSSPEKSIADDTKKSPKEKAVTDDAKKPSQKKDKDDIAQSRIEHLKKLLRLSGIRLIIKKAELDELPSHKARINYLKSLFDTGGFTGNISIKECEKFRKKRDTEKELLEIQATAVDVKGHVKGGRTLRGQGRNSDESNLTVKRKRVASSEIEDNEENENKNSSDDDEKPIIKKRRILKMEASPEVSDNE